MTATTHISLDDYRVLLTGAFDERVVAWTVKAEAEEHFPRHLIEHLGASGVFSAKWSTDPMPDVGKLVELAFALGKLASAGIGRGRQPARLSHRDSASFRQVGLLARYLRSRDPG